MIRVSAFIVAGLALTVSSMAWGQTGTPPGDDKRYTFNRVDEGYLRLDGRTGQVSICAQRPAGWVCQAVPDERAALEAEIARLQAENAAVKKELIARNLPLPESVKPDAPANPDQPRLQLPNDADLNRVMNFVEKVWRRLLDMMATVHKDLLKKQS
jgi:hypothetical protein